MKRVLAWIESRKLIAALILIGGIGGGLTVLLDAGKLVASIFEDDKIIVGTVCPILYASKCAGTNEAVREALSLKVDQIIALELTIEHGGLDKRVSICPDDETDWGSTDEYSATQTGWTVFELPTNTSLCEQENFIGFDDDVLEAARVPGGEQGAVYLIKGDFAVGVGDLTNANQPSIVNKGWYQLKKIN